MCDQDEAIVTVETSAAAPTNPGRRTFFQFIAGLAAAIAVFRPSWARAKKVAVKLAQAEALQKVGGSALLKIDDQKILFIRDTEKTVRAVNSMCSHKKCTVKFTAADGLMHCPCHKSAYALDGKVLGGPAPKPLTVYPAALEGEQIVVTLPDAPA